MVPNTIQNIITIMMSHSLNFFDNTVKHINIRNWYIFNSKVVENANMAGLVGPNCRENPAVQ